MAEPLRLEGRTFGRLTVMIKAGHRGRLVLWDCLCSCGTRRAVSTSDLTSGNSQSCGCLKTDVLRALRTRHGHSVKGEETPTWHSWSSMVARCTNPKKPRWHRYGGRGITVCDRWRDFANFLADMGEKPDGFTLERIDNDGNYEPGNCRWATPKEQGRNQSTNRVLICAGIKATVSEWAEIMGMKYNTLHERLRHGWPVGAAIFTPVRANARETTGGR